MNVEKYEVLLAVSHLKSMTAAAERLGYTQSGISQIIAALESELGFPLLVRKKSGVELTRDGEELLPLVRSLVRQGELIRQRAAEVRGVLSGSLVIGAVASVARHWLPELLARFSKEYPQIDIKLSIDTYKPIEEWLISGVADCGFIAETASHELSSIPLAVDELLIAMPKNHPLANAQTITLNDIKNDDFILPHEGMDYSIGKLFAEAKLSLSPKMFVNDDLAALAMVERGLGITLLPELLLQGQPYDLVLKPITPAANRTISLVSLHKKHRSPASERFIDFVCQQFPCR